jgi:hypothetical protein
MAMLRRSFASSAAFRGEETEMRDAFNRFIARHEMAWEQTMALLAIAFVLVGFSADDAATDPLSRLRALADLRSDGIVTEEEFATKKAELLARA